MFTYERVGEILTERGFKHAPEFTQAAPNQQGYTNNLYTICVKTFETIPVRVWYAGIPYILTAWCRTEDELITFFDECERTYQAAVLSATFAHLNL